MSLKLLLVPLSFFMLLYIFLYILDDNNLKEGYTLDVPLDDWKSIPDENKLFIQTPEQYRFALDFRKSGDDSSYYSANQALLGKANSKMDIAPVIIAPPAASEYWMETQDVPRNINTRTNTELFQSGYLGTSECGNRKLVYPVQNSTTIQQKDIWDAPILETKQFQIQEVPPMGMTPYGDDTDCGCSETTACSVPDKFNVGPMAGPGMYAQDLRENYTQAPGSDFIPKGVPFGKCETATALDEYNKNLYTNIIDPGSYYAQTQIVEPPMSNLGISETIQFPTLQKTNLGDGKVTWLSVDPKQPLPETKTPLKLDEPTNSNIYDPRSFGYGTSYREYEDPMTGQPRFFYDDIEAIRRPNFIQRSNIDDASWANSTESLFLSRELANKKFINDTQSLREDLMERSMRKYNAEVGWQKRTAPITMGRFSANLIK